MAQSTTQTSPQAGGQTSPQTEGAKEDVQNDVLKNLTSEGDTTQKPTPATEKTVQPKEGTTETDTDKSKLTRLEQKVTAQNELLQAIGINPESDVAEQYKSGLITKNQLLELAGITQPVTRPEISEEASPMDKIEKIISKGPNNVDSSDFVELAKSVKDIVTDYRQKDEFSQIQNNLNQCKQVTSGIINEDEFHKTLPDDIKQIEEQVFWGSTDNFLASEAVKTKNPAGYFNPQGYDFYGKRNLSNYQKLRNHWIEHGKKLQQQNITPQKDVINPTPSGGDTTVEPKPMITVENMDEAAKRYISQRGVV